MKTALLMTVLSLFTSSIARAETSIGLGVSALAREQASGGDYMTVSPQLRLDQSLLRFLGAAVTYDFSYQPANTSWGMSVNTHQLALRAVAKIPVNRVRIDFELGPSLRMDHSVTKSKDIVEATHVGFRPGVLGAAFLSVPFERLTLRFGAEAQYTLRWDLRATFGFLWRFA